MHRFRYGRTAAVALAATVGWNVVASTAAAAVTALSEKQRGSACALLDDPSNVRRMDGLIHRLAVICDRRDLLGGVSALRAPDAAAERVPGTDQRVNDPTGEAGPSKTQNENAIARNANTGTLCSGYNDSYSGVVTGEGFTGFSRSTDDGITFIDGGAFDPSSFGDPSMIWRRTDGHFYLATLHSSGLGIYRSVDDCQSFSLLQLGHVGLGDDKEFLAIDNHTGSPNYGRMYLVWTDFSDGGRIYSTYSDDGEVWSTPVVLSDAGADVQGAWPAVGPDGTVFVSWVRWNPYFSGPMDIELAVSEDGGATFSSAANALTGAVNPYASGATANCSRPALNGNIRYLPSPQLGVSPNGDLHIVYSYDADGRDAGDVVNVYYRRSTDKGQTWLPEVQINDDDTLTDQFFPALSVGPTGRIVIGWYDRRQDVAANLAVDYYATMSEDGGETFGPNERISDESSPIYIDPGLATCYHGDYDGSVQTATSAFLQWSDDRAVRDGFRDPDAYVDRNLFEPDFFVAASPAAASVCAPDPAVFAVTVGESLDFAEPVMLNASGLPAGTTAVFSDNPMVPESSATLTIQDTASGQPGTALIDVTGTAGEVSRSTQIALTLATGTPAPALLESPADGATEVPTMPVLSWMPAAQAIGYVVDIALDPEFETIVESGSTPTASYQLTTSLGPDTTYYWRVAGLNECGTGEFSAVRSLTTRNLICIAANVAIPDNDATGLDNMTSLVGGGIIADLDVFIDASHTWIGDLIITLTHDDSAISATLIDRPGRTTAGFGCDRDDIVATLSDEADSAAEDQCAGTGVAIEGTYSPSSPLAVFDGESLAGSWTLNVSDNVLNDFGTLNEWCLVPVLQTIAVDSDGDGVADDTDNCTDVVNPEQRDTDADGFGNVCDADLNGDCVVNAEDLGLLRSVFFSDDADADFNGDGVVNVTDLGLMRIGFFMPPGPAAQPNGCAVR